RGEAGLAGTLAIESQGTIGAAASWAEIAASGGVGALGPRLTARPRPGWVPFRRGGAAGLRGWRTATPAWVGGGYHDAPPVWRERLGVAGHQAIPVVSEGKPVAVIVLETGSSSPDSETLSLVTHAGRAYERVRLAREAKLRRSQLATLRETARMASEAQSLPAALARLTKACAQTLGARGAGLWLTEAGGRSPSLAQADGPDDESENPARADEAPPAGQAR